MNFYNEENHKKYKELLNTALDFCFNFIDSDIMRTNIKSFAEKNGFVISEKNYDYTTKTIIKQFINREIGLIALLTIGIGRESIDIHPFLKMFIKFLHTIGYGDIVM